MQICKMFGISSDFVFNPTYISNLTFVVFNDTDGISKANLSVNQSVDFLRGYAEVQLLGKENQNYRDFNKVYFKGLIESCKVGKGVFGNFFIKLLADSIEEKSNFQFVCPQMKNVYYLNYFHIPDTPYLPPSMLGRTGEFLLSVTARAKIVDIKSIVNIFNVKVYLAAI